MKNLIVYPNSEKQKILLKSLLKEMKIQFKEEEKDSAILSEEEFYLKIDRSIQQAESGKTQKLTKERQEKLLGL